MNLAIRVVVLAVALLFCADVRALAAPTWDSRQVSVGKSAGDSLLGISCPTVSLCVAVGNRGALVTSPSPTGPASAWRSETVIRGVYAGNVAGEADRTSPGTLEAVSCPSPRMCAAVSYAGDLYASANPAGGAPTWHATDLDGTGLDTHFKGISCPTVALCVAVAAGTPNEDGGRIIAIRDPLAASVAWADAPVDPSLDLQAVSCPGTAHCIAVGDGGRILASGNPFTAAPRWRELGTPGGPGNLEAVECPAIGLCLAGNAVGNVLVSGDATAAVPHWRKANAGPSVPITGISCPTSSRCAGVTNNGDVFASTNPTGPSGSWVAANLIPFVPSAAGGRPFNAFFALSCPSAALCAAVGSRGLIFTSANPFAVEGRRGHEGRTRARGPRRPRMRIVRGDHFARQARTRGHGSRLTFRLRPFGQARGFVCRLDRRKFRRCRSPLRIHAKVGRHVLRARAIGSTGLRGPVARHRFEVTRVGAPRVQG